MWKIALLWRALLQWIGDRRPVRVIEADDMRGMGKPQPYLVRYYLCKIGPLRFYLHKFLDSDPGTDLHNHPFRSVSLILAGEYLEERKEGENGEVGYNPRRPFTLAWIGLQTFHRVILDIPALPQESERIRHIFGVPVWTLFVTGARVQLWGFLRGDTVEQARRQSSDSDPWWLRAPKGRDEPKSHPNVF